MDVVTAFLNGILKEEIYMKIPLGINIKNKESFVCKLNKSLYGLKQAARCWFEVFEKVLLEELGFTSSSKDPCIFIKFRGSERKNIYAVLYVDDIVIVSGDMDELNKLKNYLLKRFHMKDLGDIKLFLGIRVTRENDQICIDQTKYIHDILVKYRMNDCCADTARTPLPSKLDYEKLNLIENCSYPSENLLGCLMYLMNCTRPDLSFSVNLISRFVNKRNKIVWDYLKSILRYLKGTVDLKLVYKRNSNNNIEIMNAYADSDWANDPTDRISISGFVFRMYENCTIMWATRKQRCVADSSVAAEYIALHEAAREAVWFKDLGESVYLNFKEGILIHEDNQGCISIAKNPINNKLTKHIDTKYHYIRFEIQRGNIRIECINTKEQLADMFTKSLDATKFIYFRNKLGLK